jgi:hypothetical protein
VSACLVPTTHDRDGESQGGGGPAPGGQVSVRRKEDPPTLWFGLDGPDEKKARRARSIDVCPKKKK